MLEVVRQVDGGHAAFAELALGAAAFRREVGSVMGRKMHHPLPGRASAVGAPSSHPDAPQAAGSLCESDGRLACREGGHVMEARHARYRWTYEDYARLPQPSEARGARFEVVDGELYVTPGPSRRHQAIVTRLTALLYRFVEENGLGEVLVSPFDVIFAEGDYVEPDIVFVRTDRLEILTERGAEGAPDLLVEVLSPSTSARDLGLKLDRYRLFGVAEYWVIDPDERAVLVWRLAEGASEPLALGPADTLRWQPIADGPLFETSVAELLRTR